MKCHPSAIVESQSVGAGTRIWAFVHVLDGATIGSNVQIGDHSFVEGGARIGDNVTIKNQVCIWDGILIEDDVFVGPRVTFTNDSNPRSPRMESAKERYSKPENWLSQTQVRRGASIGAAATICPGIEIGPFAFVAAGAVVAKNVPAFAMVVGVPAKHVGDVCSCGARLSGSHETSDCGNCGETPVARLQLLQTADVGS